MSAGAEMPALTEALTGPDAFRGMLDALSEGVYLVDHRRTIRFWNQACEQISGYTAQEVVGHQCFENILRHVDDTGTQLCRVRCPLAATMRDGQNRSCCVWLHHKDGRRLPVRVHTTPIRDTNSQRIIGGLEMFTDESAQNTARERAAELEHLVMTDPLSELPNRRYLEMALPSALADARRHQLPLGVAFIDIDHFKAVNDTHGHETGDEILRIVGGTLAANVRASDIVCRYGGEEFVVIFPHTSRTDLHSTCDRLRTLVRSSSLDLDDSTCVGATISVGATIASPDDTPDSILQRADQLLYTSKSGGRDRVTCG